jgi:multidrug resistance efflux pump
MKKFVIILVIVLLVAAGIYLALRGKTKPADTASQTTVAKIEQGSIRQTVKSTGRVVSNLDVDIKCKASGEVTKLPFDISDAAKKDELLLELDPNDQNRVLTKAEVSFSASQAQLEIARKNLDIAQRTLTTDRQKAESDLQSAQVQAKDTLAKAERVRQLLEKKLSSQEEYDTAQTAAIQTDSALKNAQVRIEELKTQELAIELKHQDVILAQAQVDMDKVDLDVAKDRLRDTRVMAPMDGVVTARNVQTGQIISSGVSNVGGGTTVLTLSDLSHIFVLASIDETDIGDVQVGQTAKITADAYQGKKFGGKVVRIATRGVNVSNVVTFEVKIEVLGEERNLLKPEMTTNVDIITAQKDNVLYAPVGAVLRQDGKYIVNVTESDGSIQNRPVEVGISDDLNKTEIISGLKEGESVVVYKSDAQSRWNAGQQARPPAGGMMLGQPRRGGRL